MDLREHEDVVHDVVECRFLVSSTRRDMWKAAAAILGCTVSEFVITSCDIVSEEFLNHYRRKGDEELSEVLTEVIGRTK